MTAIRLPSRSNSPPPVISRAQATFVRTSSTVRPPQRTGAVPKKWAGAKLAWRSRHHRAMVHSPRPSGRVTSRRGGDSPSTGEMRSAAIGRSGAAATAATPTSPVGVVTVAASGKRSSVRLVTTRPGSQTMPLRSRLGRLTTCASSLPATVAKYSAMPSTDRRCDRLDSRLSSAGDGPGSGSSSVGWPGRSRMPTTRMPAATAARVTMYRRFV